MKGYDRNTCAEERLAIALLAIVAVAGSFVDFAGSNPLIGGAVLLFGCLTLRIIKLIDDRP